MSRLEKLIEELCPDGVEYVELGSCLVSNRGGGTPSKSKPEYWNGDIPWASIKDIVKSNYYLNETQQYITEEGLNNSSSNIVEKGDIIVATRIVLGKMVIANKRIAINQDLRGLILKEFLDAKFLLYFFETIHIEGNGTTVKGISVKELEKIKIPLPPLPVQREIVRILDNFTELTAELTVELTARKQQYEYYRSKLLRVNGSVEQKNLGEIAEFKYGYTDTAKLQGDMRFIRITDIGENGKLKMSDPKYINSSEESNQYILEKNDILMARTGATYGKTMIYENDIPSVFASFLIRIRFDSSILLPAYYWHFSQSNIYWDQVHKLVKVSGQPQFNANALKMIKIPVPSIEEQKYIVDVLNRFDVICNDLSAGLPAEIEARKQQYEYYRDKLLNFNNI